MPICSKCNADVTLGQSDLTVCPSCGAPFEDEDFYGLDSLLGPGPGEETPQLPPGESAAGSDMAPGKLDSTLAQGQSPLGPVRRGLSESEETSFDDIEPDFSRVQGGKYIDDGIDDLDEIALGEADDATLAAYDAPPSEDTDGPGRLTGLEFDSMLEATQAFGDFDRDPQDRFAPTQEPGAELGATPEDTSFEIDEPLDVTQQLSDSGRRHDPVPLPPLGSPDATFALGDVRALASSDEAPESDPTVHPKPAEPGSATGGATPSIQGATLRLGAAADDTDPGSWPQGATLLHGLSGSDSAPTGGSGSSSGAGSGSPYSTRQEAETLAPDSGTLPRAGEPDSSRMKTPRSRDITGYGDTGATTPRGILAGRPSVSLQAGEVRRVGPDQARLRVARFSEQGKVDPEADYAVRKVAGEGGMGIVLLARDPKFDREVAIKKVRTHLSENESDRGKLVTEAIITAQLEHPNIVPVHELGLSSDGQPFYVMKYVEGDEWEKKVKKLNEEENLDILLKVSEAIAFAHSKNVINRDLKPGNVMLGKFGEVLVMDWGLAARLDRDTEIPPAGTPLYMAPETALEYLDSVKGRALGTDVPSSRTKRYKAGKYSDIYLLGALLFKAVTGKAPHSGKNTLDCLKNAAKNRIVQVDKKSELLEIAYKAMATDPEDRYKSATEFIDAIKSYQRHAQSLLITRRATDDLEHAEQKLTEGGAPAATATYALFSRAQHGYQNALDLWPENRRAKRQLVKAQRRYAEVAYGAGDLDLALTLLDPKREEDAPLRSEVERTIRRRKTRETWFTRLQYATAASLVLALVGAGVILVKNNAIQNLQVKAADLENRAGEATKLANTKTTEAEAATELAKAKTREAEDAEKLAKIKTQEAEKADRLAKDKTREAEEAAKLAAARTKDAALAEQLANEKTAEAERQRGIAEQQSAIAKLNAVRSTLVESGPYAASQLLPGAAPTGAKLEYDQLKGDCNWEAEGYAIQPQGLAPAMNRDRHTVVAGDPLGERVVIAGRTDDGAGKILVYAAQNLPVPDGVTSILQDGTLGRPSVEIAIPAPLRALAVAERAPLAVGIVDNDDATCVVIDLQRGVAAPVTGVRSARTIAISPDGARLVVGQQDTAVVECKIYLASGGAKLAESRPYLHQAPVNSVAVSEDGSMTASADQTGVVRVWRTDQPESIWSYSHRRSAGGSPWITALEFAPGDGGGAPALAYGCRDGSSYTLRGPWMKRGGEASGLLEWIDDEPERLQGSHAGPVTGLAFATTGGRDLLVSVGADTALVRDARLSDSSESAAPIKLERRYHDQPLLACSPTSGGAMFTSDSSGRVVRWLLEASPSVKEFAVSGEQPAGAVTSIDFDAADGRRLLVGDAAGFSRVWSTNSPDRPVAEHFVGHAVHEGMRAWFARSATPRVITVADDRRACVWDAQTGLLKQAFDLGDRPVVSPTPAGTALLAATAETGVTAEFVSLESGAKAQAWQTRPRVSAVLPLNQSVGYIEGEAVVGLRDGQLFRWSPAQGMTPLGAPVVRPHWTPIRSLTLGASPNVLFASDFGGMISRWQLDDPGVARAASRSIAPEDQKSDASPQWARRLEASADGKWLLAVIEKDGASRAELYDASTLSSGPGLPRPPSQLVDTCFAPSGEVLALDDRSRLWTARPAAERWRPAGVSPAAGVQAIECAPDGSLLVSGPGGAQVWSGSGPKASLIASVVSRPEVALARFGEGIGSVVSLTRDGRKTSWSGGAAAPTQRAMVDRGRLLACAGATPGRGALAVWNETGRVTQIELTELAGEGQTKLIAEAPDAICNAIALAEQAVACAFSGKDKSLPGVGSGTVRLWRLDGEPAGSFELPGPIEKLVISPDASVIVTLTSDQGADVWRRGARDWTRKPLDKHQITAAAFSPDGSRLLIGLATGQLLLTALEDSQDSVHLRSVYTFASHSDSVTYAGFVSRPGKPPVAVSGDASGRSLLHGAG